MILFITFIFFIWLFVQSYLRFFVFVFLSLLFFFREINLSFFTYYNFYRFYLDDVSLFISFMSFFVIFFCYFYSFNLLRFISLSFIIIFSIGFFCSRRLFFLYFFYECSLIPIIYIILV